MGVTIVTPDTSALFAWSLLVRENTYMLGHLQVDSLCPITFDNWGHAGRYIIAQTGHNNDYVSLRSIR